MFERDSILQPSFDIFESFEHESEVINGKKIIRKFTTVEEELHALYKGVGLRNISHQGIIELKGKDVLDFLHRIATNSTRDLPREGLTHTIFTNEKGRIIDVATLLNFEDFQLLVCSGEYKSKVRSWIERYTITDDVKTGDANSKYVLLELSGPQANSFVMLLCGSNANHIQPNKFKVINSEDMLFFLAKIAEPDGSVKFWFIADPENGKKLTEYMNENKGPYDFSFVGEDAYKVYRIENGIPAVPGEINDQVNPHEIRLQNYIDFKKGCYIGQEVIARLDTYDKVQRYLMGVKFHVPVSESSVFNLFDSEGKDAGRITSIAYSEKFKSYIGLAFVRRLYAEEGKELNAVSDNGEKSEVTVKSLPFKK